MKRALVETRPAFDSHLAVGVLVLCWEDVEMFLGLFAILLIMWLLGFTAFHVAGGLIHLLLILAVISLVVHFVRGRSVA